MSYSAMQVSANCFPEELAAGKARLPTPPSNQRP
jgi:hypothetical protein